MGETASEFSTVRNVSTTKLLPLRALPLIWFWLETVIIRPSYGTTSQPPASPQAGSLGLWFFFPQPTPKPWRRQQGPQSWERTGGSSTAGETEAQHTGEEEAFRMEALIQQVGPFSKHLGPEPAGLRDGPKEGRFALCLSPRGG